MTQEQDGAIGDALTLLEAVVRARLAAGDAGTSYVASLAAKGRGKIAQKLGEEATETVIAALTEDDAALTVVMAARGYPAAPEKGSVIRGVDEAAALEDVEIFHAGTAANDGALVADGGRVLNVTATGRTVAEAQAKAYEAVGLIDWPQGFCRRDIGWRAVAREEAAQSG